MRWDRFFEDLEDQLDSEWEAERAALDTEAERLRLSRIELHDRLVALLDHDLALDLHGGTSLTGRMTAVGADWCALASEARRSGPVIAPLHAVTALALPHAALLASARDAAPGETLRRRMTFGFVLRDLARRRVPVTVHLADGRQLTGTIDRAGADHLDLALHDTAAPRHPHSVTGHRLVTFTAIAAVRADAPAEIP
ncbi:hypothetical protein N3K63_00325 [Microbacterium sp. W1N]|uniref:hypothetical protein n=1 Tax=Microbacterium festucae TaxID=2977531 RepID=UPI0021BE629A|nr:hypothetical protein [Microbacterium festucae]MCT9818720.1 hypothetical protein [Microbacterium festucae]